MLKAPSPTRHNLRAAAARAVQRVLRGRSLDDALSATTRFDVPADGAMARALAYGVLRDLSLLQHIASRLLEKPMPPDDEIHILILVGLQQLRALNTPAHAAINETVGAVESLKRPNAHGLVNAVLRRYVREAEALEAALPSYPPTRYSHPAWMAKALQQNWAEQWEPIMAANNVQGPLTLRVNRRRLSRDEYMKRLLEMNIAAEAVAHVADAVQLGEPRAVERVPGFSTGQVSVQDASAQLAADLMDLRPGLRVLDACAAPGGKTAHLLEREDVTVHALDNDPQRLVRIDENLQRLKLTAQVIVGDAGEPGRWWDGTAYDRILLDAPCSGTGVIRRHPDIKWLRRESDIIALQDTQLALLKATWTTLAPGGRLVYATCSILQAEGDEIIARFKSQTENCALVAAPAPWGEATEYGRRIAPGGAHDGFYYAVLTKPA